MEFILQSFVTMIVMLVVDLPVIKYVIEPAMQKSVGQLMAKKPDGLAGALFYLGYAPIVTYLSQLEADSLSDVAINGLLIGLAAYGTYEFTNKVIMKGWTYKLAVSDTLWGGVLTALGVTAAYWVV